MAITRTLPTAKTILGQEDTPKGKTSIEIAREISETKEKAINERASNQKLIIPVKDIKKSSKSRVTFYLSKETTNKLKQQSKQTNRSMSDIIEILVEAM
jgi:hypothetical protein